MTPETIEITNPATHGKLEVDLATANVSYTPHPDFVGTDEFAYTVMDKTKELVLSAAVRIATVKLLLPTARDWQADVAHNKLRVLNVAAHVASGSFSLDWPSLAITAPPAPGIGMAAVASGTISFVPKRGAHGQTTMKYKVADIHGNFSNEGTITLDVE